MATINPKFQDYFNPCSTVFETDRFCDLPMSKKIAIVFAAAIASLLLVLPGLALGRYLVRVSHPNKTASTGAPKQVTIVSGTATKTPAASRSTPPLVTPVPAGATHSPKVAFIRYGGAFNTPQIIEELRHKVSFDAEMNECSSATAMTILFL